MWHTRIIQVFYVLSKKVGSFCFCSYTSAAAAAATNVRFHSLYRTRIACKEDGQLPEEKYNYVRYILLLFWIMTNAFHPLICRTGLNFYKAKDGCEMSGKWKRGIFWARTPLFPSSLLLFNNRKRLMLQLDLFSTLLASLSLLHYFWYTYWWSFSVLLVASERETIMSGHSAHLLCFHWASTL